MKKIPNTNSSYRHKYYYFYIIEEIASPQS